MPPPFGSRKQVQSLFISIIHFGLNDYFDRNLVRLKKLFKPLTLLAAVQADLGTTGSKSI